MSSGKEHPAPQSHQPRYVQQYADIKISPERLLLRFMAEELLAEDGTGPASRDPEEQQRRLRYSAVLLLRGALVHAVE